MLSDFPYLVSGAHAIGATWITLIAGSGTIDTGDAVTFAGDAYEYCAASDLAGSGSIAIAAPGLRQTLRGSEALTTQRELR